MSETPHVQQSAEWLIRAACRRLPANVRAERCREWTAELPAILDDESVRPSLLRALHALAFCAGISRTTRVLSRPARAGARRTRHAPWRTGGLRPNALATRVITGVAVWLVAVAGFITVLGRHPDVRSWEFLIVVALGIGFEAFCLTDLARASQVRYLAKGTWAVVCLIQIPLGGILYLSIGRIGPPGPVPPDDPQS